MTYWHNPSDIQFFEKALLQPYLRWVAEDWGPRPVGREVQRANVTVPFVVEIPRLVSCKTKRPLLRVAIAI
jgi:hypothetical protein